MEPNQLLNQITQQLSQAGLAFEVYAVGPAGVPVPAKALLPAGFVLIVNLARAEPSKKSLRPSDSPDQPLSHA
jgi:hypothetical protein